ncbi:hypothetical protein C7974DRAFT_294321, partial [Boeremia exigua]|uniref:uncharacterized protein n=1 Tax=Boeremia exigua TaxID=749465 RepID=UPI001E8DDF2F
YSSYSKVYADLDINIIYIGTPHAFYARNCLDAIAASKHVLYKKLFTLIASKAKEV